MRLLFVGREARRKGLPEVLDAFKALDARLPGALELTVVSSLSDGEISIPRMPNLTHIAQLDREAVQLRMRESHFLLMPSHFEGYGWVYLEAMAAGAVPVASDAPIQREILANGAAGVLAAPDAARLEAALLPLLNHKSAIEQLAVQAWKRCREHYLPKPVAKRMSEVFEEAKEIGAR
jgi:glycosyltransferase involved in cell wall biosynthesis